jgi:hypothetical protein
MAATFFAYVCIDELFFAPAENPDVSPQPPSAIMILVSLGKRLLNEETASKGVNWDPEVKVVDGAKAIMACVMPWV